MGLPQNYNYQLTYGKTHTSDYLPLRIPREPIQLGGNDMERNHIRISPELFPNLVLHVMACAGVGLDEEYGKNVREPLTAEEVFQIREMAKGFQVEAPALAGPLFRALFQIPCYFPAENTADMAAVYDLTVQAITEDSFAPFALYYPEETRLIYRYMPPQLQSFFLSETKKIENPAHVINSFSTIIQDVYERSYIHSWIEAHDSMEKMSSKVMRLFKEVDLIKEWEGITGLKFPYPRFHAILCKPTKFCGTSLLAERDVFSTKPPLEIIGESIIHEVGTHLFLQAELLVDERVEDMVVKDYESFVKSVEVMCQSLREPILEKAGLSQKVDLAAKMELVNELQSFKTAWEKDKDVLRGLFSLYTRVHDSSLSQRTAEPES